MDLIERYIYAVTKGLPQKQRDDVAKELRTLIDDMLSKYQGTEAYEEKVKKVLLELGDPDVLANSYRDTKKYLIGPRFFDLYMLVLKIVLGAIFVGVSIATVVKNIVTVPQSILEVFSGYLASLFSALLQGGAWVTLAFGLAERNEKNIGKELKKEPWNLSKLPQIPQKKARISPVEPIISILFSTIFISIIYFIPQVLAAYIPTETMGTVIIPIFNLEMLNNYMVLFVIMYIISISKEILKLIAGRWTLIVSVLYSIFSVISAILTLMVFSSPMIWNPNFASEFVKYTHMSFDFALVWSQVTSGIIIVIAVACILDVLTTLIKGIKYSINK